MSYRLHKIGYQCFNIIRKYTVIRITLCDFLKNMNLLVLRPWLCLYWLMCNFNMYNICIIFLALFVYLVESASKYDWLAKYGLSLLVASGRHWYPAFIGWHQHSTSYFFYKLWYQTVLRTCKLTQPPTHLLQLYWICNIFWNIRVRGHSGL